MTKPSSLRLVASATALLLLATTPTLACRTRVKQSLVAEKPVGPDYQAAAKVRIAVLVESFRFENAERQEIGPEVSFVAQAQVTEPVKGVRDGDLVRLEVEPTSRNEPFRLDQSGYVAARSIKRSNGQLTLLLD
jgi:hypothetical protein